MAGRRRQQTRATAADADAPDTFDLPPLAGGHSTSDDHPAAAGLPPLASAVSAQPVAHQPPLPDFFKESPAAPVSSTSQPHKGPSARRKRRRADHEAAAPPPTAEWSECGPWIESAFDAHHALLLPVLRDYLADGGSSGRCSTRDGFLRAFWSKEGGHCRRALATAVHFLLMEGWRAGLVERDSSSGLPRLLPGERKSIRRVADPVLQEVAEAVTARSSAHRESVEFAADVVRGAHFRLRAARAAADSDH